MNILTLFKQAFAFCLDTKDKCLKERKETQQKCQQLDKLYRSLSRYEFTLTQYKGRFLYNRKHVHREEYEVANKRRKETLEEIKNVQDTLTLKELQAQYKEVKRSIRNKVEKQRRNYGGELRELLQHDIQILNFRLETLEEKIEEIEFDSYSA